MLLVRLRPRRVAGDFFYPSSRPELQRHQGPVGSLGTEGVGGSWGSREGDPPSNVLGVKLLEDPDEVLVHGAQTNGRDEADGVGLGVVPDDVGLCTSLQAFVEGFPREPSMVDLE